MSHLLQRASELPELGVGIVHVSGLDPILEARPDCFQVLEVEPSGFWLPPVPGGDEYRVSAESLRALAAYPQPKLIHGVGFPLGGSSVPDPRHLGAFRKCIDALAAPWASEHLGFNLAGPEHDRFNTGFLLPPLQTSSGARAAAECIKRVAGEIDVPFAIETGVNYLAPREGDLRNSEFVAEVCETADCGLLLDLHNIWTNERNGREPVMEYVEKIPLDRVIEVHVAGGLECKGYWLDAHSGEVPEPLLALANEIVPRLRNLKAIIFEILPTFLPTLGADGMAQQMRLLGELWKKRGACQVPARACRVALRDRHDVAPIEWENTLGNLVTGGAAEGSLAEQLAGDGGVDLLRGLVNDFRAGMVVDALKLTSRLIMLYRGGAGLRSLLQEFWARSRPEMFAVLEAQHFAEFLRERGLDVPYLSDVLSYEEGLLRAAMTGEEVVVSFRHKPERLVFALQQFQKPPNNLAEGSFEMTISSR